MGEVFYGFDHPVYEAEAVHTINQRQIAANLLQQRLTPTYAQRLNDLANLYPTVSRPVLMGVAMMDIPLDDARLVEIAAREEEERANLWDNIRETVLEPVSRNFMLTAEGLMQEGVLRPFRTVVGMVQGMNLGEAYAAAGQSAFGRALGQLAEGNRVNIGSGFIPRSTLATDTPDFAERVAELEALGFSSQRAQSKAAVDIQQDLGVPVTQLARQQQSTGVTLGVEAQQFNPFTGRSGEAREVGASPGRVLAMGLDWLEDRTFQTDVFETNTIAWHALSGLTDTALQIWADPTAKIGRTVRTAKQARKLLTLDGDGHKWINGRVWDDWVRDEKTAGMMDRLAASTDDRNLMEIRAIPGFKQLDKETQLALNAARSRSEIATLLRKAVDMRELVYDPIAGPVSRTVGRAVGAIDREVFQGAGGVGQFGGMKAAFRTFGPDRTPWLARMGAEMSGRSINLDTITDATNDLDDWLIQAGFTVDQRGAAIRKALEASHPTEMWDVFRNNAEQWATLPVRSRLQKLNLDELKKLASARGLDDLDGLDSAAIIDRLVAEADVTDQVLRRFVQVFDHMDTERRYWISRLGEQVPHPGAHIEIRNPETGEIMIQGSPHMVVELLQRRIPLPDARVTRRALSQMNRIRNAYKVDPKNPIASPLKLDQTTLGGWADWYMDELWKPLVLLRGAWTVRVVGEEQVRMAMAGIDSVFRHPFQAMMIRTAARNIEEVEGGFRVGSRVYDTIEAAEKAARRGRIGVPARLTQDIMGQSFDLDNARFGETLSPIHRELIGKYHYQTDASMRVPITRKSVDYYQAYRDQYQRMAQDELMNKIAQNRDEAFDWWMANDNIHRNKLSAKAVRPDDPQYDFYQSLPDDPRAAEAVFNSYEARLHMATGGSARLVDPVTGDEIMSASGRVNKLLLDNAPDPVAVINRSRFVDIVDGNADLIAGIAKRKLGSVDFRNLSDPAKAHAASRSLVDEVRQYDEFLPETILGLPGRTADAQTAHWDNILERAFGWMMSRPSNRFSRSPAYRQFYTEFLADSAPFIPDELLDDFVAKFDDMAPTQAWWDEVAQRTGVWGKEGARSGLRGRMNRKLKERPTSVTSDLTLEDLDRVAHIHAMNRTKNLLYDISRKHNWADASRLIAPFAEAWWEIMSRWATLGFSDIGSATVLARRSTQIIGSGVNQGWFTEDPRSGELMFNYPAVGGALSAALGLTRGEGVQASFQGSVEGLNLFTQSFFPGVGPLLQMPVSAVTPYWLNRGTGRDIYRAIDGVVFPFGRDPLTNIEDLGRSLTPSWLDKAFMAVGEISSSRDRQRLYMNTVFDIYTARVWSGDINLKPPAHLSAEDKGTWLRKQQRDGMADAKRKGTWMWALRSVLQFGAPTAPVVRFDAEARDETGKATGEWYGFAVLAQDYRRMLEHYDNDHTQTTMWFMDRYGLDPTELMTGKSQQVEKRSVTATGVEWELANAELFRDFPATAYYAQPDDPEEDFDYEAYLRQFQQGTRRPRSDNEWLSENNNFRAKMQYEKLRRDLGDLADTKEGRAALSLVRQYLRESHPGFGEYRLTGATFAEKMRELNNWHTNPVLAESEAGQALTQYLEMRETLSAIAEKRGVTLKAEKTSADLRAALKQAGEQLVLRHPDFSSLWQFVLKGEVD